jgi:hypothetical protein
MNEHMELTCPVLPLARQYEQLARDYTGTEDQNLYDQMHEIAEAVSYLSPQSKAGAAFQIMRVSAEIDLLVHSADKPHVRKAAEQRIGRLLYRSMDALRSEANEFPNARDYLMSSDLDPRLSV